MSKRIASLGALLAASLVVASASADVPPPDSCNTPGAACNTAPPDFKSPGTCVTQKCQKPGPDGGFEVDCDLCQPNAGGAGGGSAGTGGSGTGGSGTGGSGTGGSGTSQSSDDDGGCAVRPWQAGASLSALWGALGALAWAVARRRKGRGQE
ncbi:MAG: hypothetical protein KF718_06025 [Polyangiaceae bacterium]|nr:hypothetical protein [Polyangiaceae bacterium]